jgi:NADP-dependent 3-hydroxy acid dehydrogenase YdfG
VADDRPLAGRVAAITGASSGIGEATALTLARAGAAVALAARRADRIEALAKRIEEEGGRALVRPADIAREEGARGFVEDAHARLGRLDVLVNNAGVMLLGPIEGADTEHWRRMVEVNVLGLMWCTHAALPLLRAAGGGHVVNLSSVAGRFARAGSGVYNATKFAVGAFSEALRQEVLEAGIRVTVIEPGFVATELQGHNTDPAVRAGIEQMREQAGEVLSAQQIADAILYAVTQPAHVSINEVLIRPTRQVR